MKRDLLTRLSIGVTPPLTEQLSRTTASFAVPLIGSLCQTYAALWLFCSTPWPSSLTWPTLLRTAGVFMLVTMAAHAAAVRFNRRLFREQVDAPARLLTFAIWPSVVWLPLLMLLVREESVWVAAVPPLISAAAAFSLKQWLSGVSDTAPASVDPGSISTLFDSQTPPSTFRAFVPALAISIAFQAAITELALGRPFAAGLLFAVSTVCLVWLRPERPEPYRSEATASSPLRAAAPRTLIVFLLIAIALIPYLKSDRLARELRSLLQANPKAASASRSKNHASSHPGGSSYSGIILVLPPKREHAVVPPAPVAPAQFTTPRRPVTIPFDGEYWYFKQPDRRPKPDAAVVRGEPTKRRISSTDMRPLSMEAHQRLRNPVNMNCCRAIRLAIQNADTAPGAIFIEILLENRSSTNTVAQSLGTLVLPSSENSHAVPNRSPVDEVLTFPFPAHTGKRQFDEITVAIKPARERARAGARVAIQSFELIP